MKASVGFLHAGEKSKEATIATLAKHGKETAAVHLVDSSLVDANATEFPIHEERYARLRKRAEELARSAERIVLTCSVYNEAAQWLRGDLGLRVDRSDAAGARALLRTRGPVGILVSYPPSRPVVVDYISEVLANEEQDREIRSSLTEDAPPFWTPDDVYRRALIDALAPLKSCGVLFLSQFTMNEHAETIREVWGPAPLISAVEATISELFNDA
ncbi:MAG TPA: hypothetical protein VMD07_00360 [Candidatus Acidoferrales bacterium]|nr:hypothetical protein [Candidatus Acidoferrales bacterium]